MHGERGDEIRVVEGNVQFAVGYCAGCLDVGHVEGVGVGAAREARVQHVAHLGAGAVAAGDVGCPAGFLGTVRKFQLCFDVIAVIDEAEQFSAAFDLNAEGSEMIDEQAFMVVLRQNQHVREWADAFTDRAEFDARRVFAAHPQICGREMQPGGDCGLGDADLLVEFEGACVDDEGAGCCARLGGFVDNAHRDAEACQPDRQHQPCRPRPNNKDLWLVHIVPLIMGSGAYGPSGVQGRALAFLTPLPAAVL